MPNPWLLETHYFGTNLRGFTHFLKALQLMREDWMQTEVNLV